MSAIVLDRRFDAKVSPDLPYPAGVATCPSCGGVWISPADVALVETDFNCEMLVPVSTAFDLDAWECRACGYVGPLVER